MNGHYLESIHKKRGNLCTGKKKLRALVLCGDGINCHQETAAACDESGFSTTLIHVNDLLQEKPDFRQFQLFCIPGGFSFGDELGSGKVLALKLEQLIQKQLQTFLEEKGCVLGICNGFQMLVQWGVFGAGIALAHNNHGKFMNRWSPLKVIGTSIFTKGLEEASERGLLEFPVRHGEGRLVFSDIGLAHSKMAAGQCVMQYKEDINGSWDKVAALSAFDGRVLGMMPHPEAFWSPELYPGQKKRAQQLVLGTRLFQNAYDYLKSV